MPTQTQLNTNIENQLGHQASGDKKGGQAKSDEGIYPLAKKTRPATPNPFYHHQKRKLMLKYQQQLLEKEMYE